MAAVLFSLSVLALSVALAGLVGSLPHTHTHTHETGVPPQTRQPHTSVTPWIYTVA